MTRTDQGYIQIMAHVTIFVTADLAIAMLNGLALCIFRVRVANRRTGEERA